MTERFTLEHNQPKGIQDQETLRVLSVGDDFVSIADLIRKSGVNKNGKKWGRLELQRSETIKLREYKDGRPMVNVWNVQNYRLRTYGQPSKLQKRVTNTTPLLEANRRDRYQIGRALPGEHGVVAVNEFLNLYRARHGADSTARFATRQALRDLAYPMLKDTPWRYERGLGRALRHPDARGFVGEAFGSTRYRKDLVKALSGAQSLTPVAAASALRGLIPVDWMVEAIRDGDTGDTGVIDYEWFRKLAKLTDERSRKRLLMQLCRAEAQDYIVADTFQSMQKIIREGASLPEMGRIDSWRDVHDRMATEARRAIQVNKPVNQDAPIYQALDAQVVCLVESKRELKIVSAKDTDMLQTWGLKMNNCIGGYDRQATKGSTFLFGIYEGSKLLGNMEVSPKGTVRQLVGKHNRTPEFHDAVRDFVHEATGYAEQERKDAAARVRAIRGLGENLGEFGVAAAAAAGGLGEFGRAAAQVRFIAQGGINPAAPQAVELNAAQPVGGIRGFEANYAWLDEIEGIVPAMALPPVQNPVHRALGQMGHYEVVR